MEYKQKLVSDPGLAGLVIVNYGKHLLVEDSAGTLVRCVARRNLERAVCGDHVQWLPNADGSGVVEAILPRQTVLQRHIGTRSASPLAANLDQLLIVAAPEPGIDAFLLDKYTVTAELAQLAPVIVLNKSDLLADRELQAVDELLAGYRAIGYRCLLTSARENAGMEAFRACLQNRTSILLGQSGVGKSSLIKRLLPDLDIEIGRLSAASGQGRHTTTATTLYHLPGGGDLIDSPGVRDFHPDPVPAGELGHGFREFREYAGQCRFSDCLHNGEPGCAVEQAMQQGRIDARRMESYRRLLLKMG
jgi:ribosome biogenesis GTPase